MAVQGYITHAARNRRFTAGLVLLYIVAFQLIGAFALTWPLLMIDEEHTILSNPSGYAMRYVLPLAALSLVIFWRLYRGHAKAIAEQLHVNIVTRQEEPRFVTIAEQVCTTLGIRTPRFGVIEVPEANAVTVGDSERSGLIAVTRGLLDLLDDDELAAVLAHEASHIRHGDTKVLAANHALMRTGILFQTNNFLRLENWRQLIVTLVIPPLLLIFLTGSAVTMLSMQLARFARRGLKLTRDHIADGEAVRVTHFPEALISAIEKIAGKGTFPGSHRVEGLLFEGPADHEGGTHPTIEDRLSAIATLGCSMMQAGRLRQDTRGPSRARFGRRSAGNRSTIEVDREGRPLVQPATGSWKTLALYFTDRTAYREWEQANTAWFEWRASGRRNMLGLKPDMVVPVLAITVVLLISYWPAYGDFSQLARRFGPGAMVDIARQTNSGPFCMGSSYKDGKCPGYDYKGKTPYVPQISVPPGKNGTASGAGTRSAPPPALGGWVGIFMMLLVGAALFRPKLIRRLFGHVSMEDSQAAQRRLRQPAAGSVLRLKARLGRETRVPEPEGLIEGERFDLRIQRRLRELERENQAAKTLPRAGFGRKLV